MNLLKLANKFYNNLDIYKLGDFNNRTMSMIEFAKENQDKTENNVQFHWNRLFSKLLLNNETDYMYFVNFKTDTYNSKAFLKDLKKDLILKRDQFEAGSEPYLRWNEYKQEVKNLWNFLQTRNLWDYI
jgi:hypothetical protein